MLNGELTFFPLKVADFGLASTDGATIDSGKLPIKWTAPEVIMYKLWPHIMFCFLKKEDYLQSCRHWGILTSPTSLTCGASACCSGRSIRSEECPIQEFLLGMLWSMLRRDTRWLWSRSTRFQNYYLGIIATQNCRWKHQRVVQPRCTQSWRM